jgi:NADH:ubiquinone oxidoreductase subunit 6 (subunit J)
MSPAHIALSAIVVALAVVSVASRHRAQAGMASALCTLSLAGVLLTLSTELLVLTWALMGTGMLLMYLAADGRGGGELISPSRNAWLWRLWPLLGALFLWTGLLGGLVVGHIPGETFAPLLRPGEAIPEPVSAQLLSTAIHGRYAPALIGLSLTLLAASMAGLAARRER